MTQEVSRERETAQAELLAAARGYVDAWDDCENTSDDQLSALLIVLRFAIERADGCS